MFRFLIASLTVNEYIYCFYVTGDIDFMEHEVLFRLFGRKIVRHT